MSGDAGSDKQRRVEWPHAPKMMRSVTLSSKKRERDMHGVSVCGCLSVLSFTRNKCSRITKSCRQQSDSRQVSAPFTIMNCVWASVVKSPS